MAVHSPSGQSSELYVRTGLLGFLMSDTTTAVRVIVCHPGTHYAYAIMYCNVDITLPMYLIDLIEPRPLAKASAYMPWAAVVHCCT